METWQYAEIETSLHSVNMRATEQLQIAELGKFFASRTPHLEREAKGFFSSKELGTARIIQFPAQLDPDGDLLRAYWHCSIEVGAGYVYPAYLVVLRHLCQAGWEPFAVETRGSGAEQTTTLHLRRWVSPAT